MDWGRCQCELLPASCENYFWGFHLPFWDFRNLDWLCWEGQRLMWSLLFIVWLCWECWGLFCGCCCSWWVGHCWFRTATIGLRPDMACKWPLRPCWQAARSDAVSLSKVQGRKDPIRRECYFICSGYTLWMGRCLINLCIGSQGYQDVPIGLKLWSGFQVL